MTNNSFFPTIKLPTRFSTYSCSLLDNIFYSQNSKCHDSLSGIILTDISDHLPCFTNIKFKTNFAKRPPKTCPPKFKSDTAMQNLLNDLSSQNVYSQLDHNLERDPNYNNTLLSKIVRESREKHFPSRLVKYKKNIGIKITNGLPMAY